VAAADPEAASADLDSGLRSRDTLVEIAKRGYCYFLSRAATATRPRARSSYSRKSSTSMATATGRHAWAS
jgi:hypothetical protein